MRNPDDEELVNESGLLARWRSLAPYLLSLLRIVAALLFMQVGTAKLFAFPAAVMPGGGTAPFGSLAWVAGFLEVFGGGLLLVGLFTRPIAFLLSGEMAFAYFLGHALWEVRHHPSLHVSDISTLVGAES